MLKVAPNPENNCRNEFQEENLKLSNKINSGEFSTTQVVPCLLRQREVALLLLLVRKAQNNRTSNSKRSKVRDGDLKNIEQLLNYKLDFVVKVKEKGESE